MNNTNQKGDSSPFTSFIRNATIQFAAGKASMSDEDVRASITETANKAANPEQTIEKLTADIS